MADVGNYPFKQARNFTKGRDGAAIKWIVIHDMESGETDKTAANVAAMFAGTDAPQASAHLCVDNAETIRCVHDADTAWHAPGANKQGLGIEHAGRASQTRTQWLDDFGKQMIERSAAAAAAWAQVYKIPVVHLTVDELKAGKPGFIGHVDATNAWHKSDHTDPGSNFPWDYYLARVKAHFPRTSATVVAHPAAAHPETHYTYTHLSLHLGDKNADVTHVQTVLKHLGLYAGLIDGDYGPKTVTAVREFQTREHLGVDGVVGPITAKAIG